MVSCFIFRSENHFGFIFVYDVRDCSNFIDLHVTVQLSSTLFAEETVFSIVYSCILCRRLIDCRCVGLFLGSLFCSIKLYVCFCASTVLFFVLFCFVLFLAALGLHCCTQAFSSCVGRGLLFLAVRGLLIAVASLVAEHGL